MNEPKELQLSEFRKRIDVYVDKVSHFNEIYFITKFKLKRVVVLSIENYNEFVSIKNELDRLKERKNERRSGN